jgi:hypothetical protein
MDVMITTFAKPSYKMLVDNILEQNFSPKSKRAVGMSYNFDFRPPLAPQGK